MDYSQFTNNFLNSMLSPQPKRNIVSVNGLSEAKLFSLGRGENIILRDCNDDLIYVKSCDEMGKYTLKVYSCLDITEQVMNESSIVSATKSDVEKLSNELNEVKTMFKELMKEHNAERNDGKHDESVSNIQKKS